MSISGLFDLTGSIVLITGGSRGIGLAVARHMLASGANVAINGYDADETMRAAMACQTGTGAIRSSFSNALNRAIVSSGAALEPRSGYVLAAAPNS